MSSPVFLSVGPGGSVSEGLGGLPAETSGPLILVGNHQVGGGGEQRHREREGEGRGRGMKQFRDAVGWKSGGRENRAEKGGKICKSMSYREAAAVGWPL
jgi:hypothetical protein